MMNQRRNITKKDIGELNKKSEKINQLLKDLEREKAIRLKKILEERKKK